MTSPQGLHLKTIILVLIMICVAPLGDTFLGKGMKQIGAMRGWAPADLFHFFFRAFTSRHGLDRHRLPAHLLYCLPFGPLLGGL